MRQTFVLAVALAAVAAGFFSTGADAQANCKGFIADLEAGAGNLGISQFVNLLKETNAVSAGAYTIFAPEDSAISGAVQALGIDGPPSNWTENQIYILTNVLLYHIAPGNLPSSGISKFGASVNTLANNIRLCTGAKALAGDKNITDNFNSLTLKVTGTTVTVKAGADTATVTEADLNVTCLPNVIIHKIDKVLLPCDFTKYLTQPLPSPVPSPSPSPSPKKSPARASSPAKCATGSTVFKALNSSITDATVLPSQLKSTLQPEFTGTVFVPSDAAVLALSASLNVSADSLEALQKSGIFTELLSYHVVPTTIYEPKTPGTTILTTLLATNTEQTFCTTPSNGTLTGVATTTSVTIKSATDSVTVIDSIPTCTGVIHIIDGILLPCTPPTNIQALLAASNSTLSPATTNSTPTTGSRGVTLVGSSPAPANATPATSTPSGAATLAPPALLALALAFLLAQLL